MSLVARGRKKSTVELGHDAFLDIVANLVGVLIILVVVLGTRSRQVAEVLRQQVTEAEVDMAPLSVATAQAESARSASMKLENDIAEISMVLDVRRQERGALNDLLMLAKEAWEQKQTELDHATRESVELESEKKELQRQLAQTRGAREEKESESEPVVALEHLPTPMARTVFGEEIHFRLKDNRLSVVPLDRLLELIRSDFQRNIAGRDGLSVSRVGPIQGYVAEYEMERQRMAMAQNGQIGTGTQVSLVGLVIQPVNEPHGQSIDQVFQGQSLLDVELAGRDPAKTTITIWVYPDSFAALRRLKEYLYRSGFATAARPLPMDREISGSPTGSRSNAQ